MVDEEEDLEDRDEALLDDHNYNVNSGGMVRRGSDEEHSGEYGGMSRSSPMASGGKSRHRSSSVGSDPGDETSSPQYESRAAPRRAISTMAPPPLPSAALANLAMSAPPAEPTHISRLFAAEARTRTESGRPLDTLDEEVEQKPPACANSSALEAGSTAATPVSISRADDVGSDEATVSPVSPPPLDFEDELRPESGTEFAEAPTISETKKAQ